MRTFDLPQQFESIKKSATEAIHHIFPVEGKTRRLVLDNVTIEDKLDPTDYADQSKAKSKEATWGVPVNVGLSLIDKQTNKVLDKVASVRLFLLPKSTARFSYIVGGNEYQVSNQLRLKSGVYTIRAQNGELKTQVNLEQGRNFIIKFDEQKAGFTITKVGGNQANIPLYPILLSLGISHDKMVNAWGAAIANANKTDDPKAVAKANESFGVKKGTTLEQYFEKTKMNPNITKMTLGQSFDKVSGEMLLASSQKLLNVHLGKTPAEDRDSLQYKEIHSLDDFIKERLEKNKQTLLFKVLRTIDNPKRTKISQIINPGTFNSVIESFFTQDDKSATPEQTNPLDMLSGQYKATITGSGGIASEHAITSEMREVHNSHFGFLDPIHSPESHKIGANTNLPLGVIKDGNDLKKVVVDIHGKLKAISPTEAFNLKIAFPGQETKSVVSVMYKGKSIDVPKKEVDYFTPNAKAMFSWSSNLIPFLASNQGNRAMMAAKQMEQAISLKYREEPLVQVGMEKAIGNQSAIMSPDDGVIKKVDKDFLILKTSHGDVKLNLYNNFSLNRKSFLHHDPIVKVGDKVKKGQLLSDSNFTKNGVLALGTNLKSVSGDTKTFWIDEDGKAHYEEIRNVLPRNKIQTLTIDKMQGVIKPLKAFIGHYTDEGMVSVRTWSGYDFKCTESHSLVCLRDGKLVEVKPKDIKIDQDFIPRLKKVDMPVLDKFIDIGGRCIKLSREFGELCGLYASEGCTTHSAVSFAATDLVVRDRIRFLVKDVLPGVNINDNADYYIIVYSARLKHFFEKEFGRGADNKKIPGFAFVSPKEFKEGLISGYWAGDGCIRATSSGSLDITAYSNSRNLRDGIAFLGLSIGLRFNYLNANGHTKAIYGSRLTNLDAPKFPFVYHSYKQHHLEVGIEKAAAWQSVDMIPLTKDDIAHIRNTTKSLDKVERKTLLRELSQGYINIAKLANLYPTHPLLFSNLSWERISSIEHVDYEEWVYDFDMGTTPYFMVSNGLFVHNTAYIPFRGLNFEDGIVISETAAKKLTSEHIHKKDIARGEGIITNLSIFRLQYPNALPSKNVEKLDAEGVVKKGQIINLGDVVIAALQKRHASEHVGVIKKQLADRPKNISIEWTYEDPGYVTEVRKTSKYITVYIRTEEPAKIGDKLAGKMGNKGIITAIIPDSEAPRNADGEAVEMLLNPHGVISRINIGQIYESATGKVAKKTGEPIIVKNFDGENHLEKTKKLLKDNGVDDKEELFDSAGKSIGRVHVGYPHTLKLYKTSQGNFSYRQGGPGSAYDANLQPLKQGGEESAKALDLLTIYAMLSHGARANLRDMSTIKASQNDEYWNALKSGQPLPPPKAPFVYDKFMTYLKGAGIDVKKDGSKLTLAPLTDKEVLSMSSGEVTEAKFWRGKDMRPAKDGFMDPVKLGGFHGKRWGHVKLTESIVNPVFENAVKKLTGLGGKFDEIVKGKLWIDKDGEFNKDSRGITGGPAIEKILNDIDVDEELKILQAKIRKTKSSNLDDINKKIRYLLALKKNKMTPSQAYMRKVLPVIPPMYRPVYSMADGNITTADVNLIYQNIGVLNTLTKLPVYNMLPDSEKSDIRNDMYEHAKGLSGITDLNIKGKEREGFISEIKGGSGGQPKEGFFISKMLGKKQDYVGRGTIIPEPSLGIDQIALPEKMAWKLFEPFIVKELSRFGKTPNQAMDEINKKTPLAQKAIEIVMRDRKILLKRDPSLHKFNILAFRPQITSGTAIKIPPLITRGFNCDFDGDTMMTHVPISNEANAEAEKMLPSNNLFQPGTGALMIAPSQEAQMGIYLMSKTPKGRKELEEILGEKVDIVLDKKETHKILKRLAKDLKAQEYGEIVSKLKSVGEKYTYDTGFTLGLDDLHDFSKERDKIIDVADNLVKKSTTQKEMATISKDVNDVIDKMLSKKFKDKGNPLFDMIASGARGDASQLRSIMASQLYVTDAKGRIIPKVIRKSYSEGLDPSEYWTSAYGARRGMMDRAIQTSLPGTFSKDIMANTIDNVVSATDCGTKKGIVLPVASVDILDRYLAGDQGGLSHNTLIDKKVQNLLTKKGLKLITVRSPLTCLQPKGTCAKCFGLDERGQDPEHGENLGAKAGQTISEPLVQLVMNCSEGLIEDSSGKLFTFEDLYGAVDKEESFDGVCYSKEFSGSINDLSGPVDCRMIQHHDPDGDMVFIKTKSGRFILVQTNHPMWVNGSEKLAEEITKEDYLDIKFPCLENKGSAPVEPYFLGRYMADGCVRYGNGTKKYEGVPVATIITGADIEIKNKTASCVDNTTISPKDVQVYNPEFSDKMRNTVFGREAKTKRLMPGFNLWCKEDLEKLLAGWIDGGGSVFLKNNTTTVNLYTSSYRALAQLDVVCLKLGIKCNVNVVPRGPLQKTPAFMAQLRFYDKTVYNHSIKMQRLEFFPGQYPLDNIEGPDRVNYIKILWMWDQQVWDVKTSSGSFICGSIKNHNTFHTGGAAGTGASVTGYQRIDQLLKMPDIVVGSTVLAPSDGKITKIQKGIAGGYEVYVDGVSSHISKGLKLLVKVGDHVKRGDALSEGPIRPQDLVKHKGMLAAQEYIVDELHKAYSSQRQTLQRKIFETVIRSVANTTKVTNNPKHSDFIAGDIISYTAAQHYNENLSEEISIEDADGHILDKSYGPFREGHELSQRDITALRMTGIHKVLVRKEAIKHEPMLKGVTTLPMLKKNWMSALGYRNLAKALLEGSAQSWETDLSDYHPVPALVHGATFGKGEEGRY